MLVSAIDVDDIKVMCDCVPVLLSVYMIITLSHLTLPYLWNKLLTAEAKYAQVYYGTLM